MKVEIPLRHFILGAVIGLIGAAIWYLNAQKAPCCAAESGNSAVAVLTKEDKERKYEKAKEIVNPSGFINTDKVTVQEYIGKKVILLDFWTYSCINCQRTMPYMTAWWEKYKDKGLIIIGMHTPEFEFEKNRDNVVAAVNKFGVQYPVVQDNEYDTWRAYQNQYWPRKYLIDIDGYIVYDHIGEGRYDETEKKIQELLKERDSKISLEGLVGGEVDRQIDLSQVKSPEIYFGYARNTFLANGIAEVAGIQALRIPEEVETNKLYLGGVWEFQAEYAGNNSQEARVVFPYQSKDVYMVASAQKPLAVQVFVDGKMQYPGVDVVNGVATVEDEHLYHLVSAPDYAAHRLELVITIAGGRFYTFTFG